MESVATASVGAARDAARPTVFDEETFRLFYEKTARPLRGYLLRMTGDVSCANDLLQESYLRMLAAKLPEEMSVEHLKNYLFRVATNLLRDRCGHRKTAALKETDAVEQGAETLDARTDVRQMLEELKPRERQLLWLAYVEQFSHEEIAGIVGAKTNSIRPMLARAREKLARMLRTDL